MSPLKLPTVLVGAHERYDPPPGVTAGDVARYLSRHEAYVSASTLELARPVMPNQRLRDVDVQVGDRLVIFTRPPRPHTAPPAPPDAPTETVLRFTSGDWMAESRGRRRLVLGKPDEHRGFMPDLDLRPFLLPYAPEFLSRECLLLEHDGARWTLRRLGVTHVQVDDLELGSDPMPLDSARVLRFYRAADRGRPLGEVRVEAVDAPPGEGGAMPFGVVIGAEQEPRTVHVSDNLALERIVGGLVAYTGDPLTPDYRLYLLRLLPPDVRVQTLELDADEFLYLPRRLYSARYVLVLRDVHDRARTFLLPTGLEDERKLLGVRAAPDVPDPALDVDLYELVRRTDVLGTEPRYQCRVWYRGGEGTWWLLPEERAWLPAFLNTTRLSAGTPVQLAAGDVLTFGASMDDYAVRLEVDVVGSA